MSSIWRFAALAMSVLMITACDPGVATDDITGPELAASDDAAFAKVKTLVCHVGNKSPEYDPECKGKGKCGDAGKIDLIEVPDVTKHIDNPDHSFGDVSDYLPGDEGASGVGNQDTSDDGVFVDDGCVIPDETVFAIAYTDVIDNGAYFDPGVDVLIAKLVDADGSGDVSVGDEVITDRYPTNLAGTLFGTFGVTVHTVTAFSSVSVTPTNVEVRAGSDTFQWFDVPTRLEFYFESNNFRFSTWQDGFAFSIIDVLFTSTNSPSQPSGGGLPSIIRQADDTFIDVEIFVQ